MANFIKRQLLRIMEKGPGHFLQLVWGRLHRKDFRSFSSVRSLLRGRSALEIGGPTRMFLRGNRFPIYPVLDTVDNCNFSNSTTWEGNIDVGRTFTYDSRKPLGLQFIGEATDLHFIESHTYSAVLASHTIEHTANPIKAIEEWKRILSPGGIMVFVIPHKDGTFDRARPVTPLAHILKDYHDHTPESDLTHLQEILSLHDFSRDIGMTPEDFRVRSESNLQNRCLHHHVFHTYSAVELVNSTGLQIIAVEARRPYDILIIAELLECDTPCNNSEFLNKRARYLRDSPFASDQLIYNGQELQHHSP